MSKPDREEFYVGYAGNAPAGVAAFLRKRILGLLAIAMLIALLLILGQARFAVAAFEFGTLREFQGVMTATPYPALLVERPASAQMALPYSRYHLVGPGKHGVDDAARGLAGRTVSVTGTLIYRDDQTMIEIDPASLRPLDAAPRPVAPGKTDLGQYTLRGEIVDSKCYLGVMKPGRRKPHRACAVRCISGGIPPLFLVNDADGNALHLLLTGSDGRMINKEVLDRVAVPLEITGEVVRQGGVLVLQSEPDTYRRL